MTAETWKAVSGYEGLYEVSDHGRVRSLDRVVSARNRWGTITQKAHCGRVLKLHRHAKNGYVSVALGQGNVRLVHRLIASAFLPNPDQLREVNHKNLVRDDNRTTNLEWVSSSGNKHHSYGSGTRKQHGKTTPVRLRKGGRTVEFESELAAAKHLGVNAGSVHSALTRDHRCCGYRVELV